jgi:hypothetical protein
MSVSREQGCAAADAWEGYCAVLSLVCSRAVPDGPG